MGGGQDPLASDKCSASSGSNPLAKRLHKDVREAGFGDVDELPI